MLMREMHLRRFRCGARFFVEAGVGEQRGSFTHGSTAGRPNL
jgi:hypothetical protein